MTLSPVLALLGAAGVMVFLAFVVLEERGRPQVALGLVLAVLVVDAMVYRGQDDVPPGLLRLSVGGQSLRLTQIVIVTALLARLVARGFPRRVTLVGLTWAAFFTWYVAAAFIGMLRGNSPDWMMFQAKAVVDVGGAMALAAGVPVVSVVRHRLVLRWTVVLGVVAFALVSLSETSVRLAVPFMPGGRFGEMGADAASVLVSLGVVALVLEACRQRRRLLLAVAAVPLMLSPFAGRQRAAVVNLAAAVAVIGLVALGRTWRRRMRTTNTEVGLFLAALVAPFLLIIAYSSATATSGTSEASLPFTDVVTETFFSTAKQQSADTRVALWKEGTQLYQEHPWIGWGLGKEYRVFAAGSGRDLIGGGFHSVTVDLLVRIGVIGLLLFVGAVAVTLVEGWRAWVHHPDSRVAALAMGCAAAAVGLLGKGAAESILEKFRLATMLGLLMGLVLSAGRTRATAPEEQDEDEVVTESAPAWS